MTKGEERILVIDAEIYSVKIAPEKTEDADEKSKNAGSSSAAAAVKKKDFSDVFSRLKKSARQKSSGIL